MCLSWPLAKLAWLAACGLPLAACDLLICCVDSRAARRTLRALAFKGHAVGNYWLNLGNTASTAQAVRGQPRAARRTSPSALKSV